MIKYRAIFTITIGILLSLVRLAQAQEKKSSGNPVFPGWYADPEGFIKPIKISKVGVLAKRLTTKK